MMKSLNQLVISAFCTGMLFYTTMYAPTGVLIWIAWVGVFVMGSMSIVEYNKLKVTISNEGVIDG